TRGDEARSAICRRSLVGGGGASLARAPATCYAIPRLTMPVAAELRRTMKYDVEFNSGAFYPAEADVRLAEIAEDKGFGAVWKGESNSTDPIVLLSAMAARTTTIQLGTAVYHMFGRSPITMGIQAATLNDLSDG